MEQGLLRRVDPVVHIAEHAGQQAVEDDIRAFLAAHEQADGSYAIESRSATR